MSQEPELSREIRLRILGEHGSIDVEALHKALGSLLELLKAGGIATEMVIADLREGSAEVAIRPRQSSEEIEARFAEIVGGLGRLHEQRVDPSWDTGMLEGAVDLATALSFPGVSGLQVVARGDVTADISQVTLDTAKDALASSTLSVGSVTGRIYRFFDHKSRREFGMIDDATQHSVRVTFTLDKETRVLRAVGRTVTAWGELRRNRDGRKILLKLDDFEVVSARSRRRPELDEMAGALGTEWSDELGSVESVRRQRDGE